MKLKDFLVGAGTAVLSSMPPYGPVALAAINGLMPAGKGLDPMATADAALKAIGALPTDKQITLHELDLQHQSEMMSYRASAMNAANSSVNENYQKTRAYIAKQVFHILAFTVISVCSLLIISVLKGDFESLSAMGEITFTVGVVTGPLMLILQTYMGVLKSENRDRLNTSIGRPALGLGAALISSMRKK